MAFTMALTRDISGAQDGSSQDAKLDRRLRKPRVPRGTDAEGASKIGSGVSEGLTKLTQGAVKPTKLVGSVI
jgi:hypothetical protein